MNKLVFYICAIMIIVLATVAVLVIDFENIPCLSCCGKGTDSSCTIPSKKVQDASEATILAANREAAEASIQRGVNMLLAKQLPDGSWMQDPAMTALATLALAKSHAKNNVEKIADAVEKGLEFCLKHQQKDGSFSKGGRYTNYTTSIVTATLAQMNRPQYKGVLLKARHFLIDSQLDEDHDTSPTTDTSPFKGGIGYGGKGVARPDLSNTQLALEAIYLTEHLEDESTPEGQKNKEKSDLAWKNALLFLRHCQNIPESADGTWVVSSADSEQDGGFIYKPDETKASGKGSAGLRSYGSMTYAGLKSMIYAKLKKDDFRVKAARQWAKDNYTLKENPGLGSEGRYYYYQTFAKANAVYGDDIIVDKNGVSHNWRDELLAELVSLEKDGTWENENGRWMESIPELVTAYTLLSYEILLGY